MIELGVVALVDIPDGNQPELQVHQQSQKNRCAPRAFQSRGPVGIGGLARGASVLRRSRFLTMPAKSSRCYEKHYPTFRRSAGISETRAASK